MKSFSAFGHNDLKLIKDSLQLKFDILDNIHIIPNRKQFETLRQEWEDNMNLYYQESIAIKKRIQQLILAIEDELKEQE